MVFGAFRPFSANFGQKNGQNRLKSAPLKGGCSMCLAVWGRGSVAVSQVTINFVCNITLLNNSPGISPCSPAEDRRGFLLIFGRELCGKFEGNFAGIFWTHKIEGSKFPGKFRSTFREKFRSSTKKSFVQTSFLHTCHPNKQCHR